MNKLKNIFSIGIGNIFASGISAIFWLYLANLLDVEEYGQLNYFVGIAGMAEAFSVFGITAITVHTAKNTNTSPVLFLLTICATAFSSTIVFFTTNRFDISLLIFGFALNDLSLALLLGKKSYVQYTKSIFLQKILMVILSLGFYHFFGINSIIYGMSLSYAIFLPNIYSELKNSKIDFALLKIHKKFLINNYIISLVGGLRAQLDKLMIAPLLGFTLLGNYSLSYQVYTALMTFSAIIYKFTLPEDASNNPNRKVKTGTIIIAVSLSILGVTILPQLLASIFPKFIHASSTIQIMSLAVIPSTIVLMYDSKFLGAENSLVVLIGKAISTITLVIGITLLGSAFNLFGVAITFVISPALNAIFLFCIDKMSGRE